MAIITLATVKTNLGLTDSTYDAAITAAIPRVEAIVKEYTGLRFNSACVGTITSGSDLITVTSLENVYFRSETSVYRLTTTVDTYKRTSSYLSDYFKVGDYLSGTGIPSGAYVIDVDDIDIKLQISANATGNGTAFTQGFNLIYDYPVSQLVWYFVRNSTTSAAGEQFSAVRSKSQLSTSVTYADSEINKKYGVPTPLLNALPYNIRMQ